MTPPTYTIFKLAEYLRKIEDGSLVARRQSSSRLIDIILPDEIENPAEAAHIWYTSKEKMGRVGELKEFDLNMFSALEERCDPRLILYKINKITGKASDKTPIGFSECDIDYIGDYAKIRDISSSCVREISGNCRIRGILHSTITKIGENAEIGGTMGIYRCDVGTIEQNVRISILSGGTTKTIGGQAVVGQLTNPSIEEIERARKNIEEDGEYRGHDGWADLFAEWDEVIARGIEEMRVGSITDQARILHVGEEVKIDQISGTAKIDRLDAWTAQVVMEGIWSRFLW